MKTRKILALLLCLVMVFSLCGSAFAAHDTDEVTELEANNSDTAEWIAEQTYVLLENNGVLPIAKSGSIAVFGAAAETTIKGGTGSGDVYQRAHDNIGSAFEAAGYTIANPTWMQKMADTPRGSGCLGTPPKEDLPITDEELAEAAAAADTVVYAIARNAGEGDDRIINDSYFDSTDATPGVYKSNCGVDHGVGNYEMSELELENVGKLCDAFENVIVVYNSMVMDTTWMADYDIDAAVFMGNGGQRGSEALVNILNGTATPSGKLVDTWALDAMDYPSSQYGFSALDGNVSTEYYTEGIYMGYRYFDTFGKDVAYEFGYGLSYTDFDITVDDVAADSENVTVTATVTNIGDTYSGKEVVQVYFSAPDGKTDKPYQELAAYGKTDELEPAQQQTLTLTFNTADMSSYVEDEASYIMDAGDYIIRVGNSSRNTVAAAVITLDEEAVTEIMYNQLALEDGAVLDELTKDGATPIANNDAEELENAIRIDLKAADIPCVDHRDNINDDETVNVYLLSEDYANFVPREDITIRTSTIVGVIQNAEYPNGDGNVTISSYDGDQVYDNAYNGYQETTYSEVGVDVGTLPEGITKESAKLTDVLNGTITMQQFVACLSVDELARLCVGGAGTVIDAGDGTGIGAAATAVDGGAGQTTQEFIETRHIPTMPNADGPAGVRITQFYYVAPDGTHYTGKEGAPNAFGGWDKGYADDGWTDEDMKEQYQFCTAFPVGTNIAQSWDIAVAEAFGNAYGSEMKEYGVTTCLCPGMDMHRNPLCGRNFEYYSEDPLVSGMSAAYFTLGIQSYDGIGVCLKHFWGNEQEDNRNALNNVIGERTARELYLKQFEIAVKLAQPQTVMNCYNENNGWPGSDSWDCNEDILRGEWGFSGYVMTDWGGGQSTAFVAKHGGCDMVMPGGDASVILDGILAEPTFNEDGSIANQGSFTFDVNQGEPPTYTIETNLTSADEAPDSVKEAVEAGYASIFMRGGKVNVGWYGCVDEYNKISIGDLQKSVIRVLNVALQSQDMEILMAGLGEELEVGSFSANNGALACAEDFIPMVQKGEITAAPAIVAAVVNADTSEGTAEVPVQWLGDGDLTTVRMTINCEIPVAVDADSAEDGNVVITSANDIEYNPETREIIVYKGDGSALDTVLFTVSYDIADADGGEYPVDISLIEVTDADGAITNVLATDGALILTAAPKKGDVNGDRKVDNADLIMIARYLVNLVEFDDTQMELADYNDDGIVNNTDLVLIARAIVEA